MEADISNNNQKPDDIPVIDGFELLDKRGESVVSSVWKARQISLGRTVIIKVLSKHHSNDPEDVKQFKFEAKVAASLKHPGIVQVYDFGRSSHADRYFFVMEYITGYTVGQWLRRKGRLSEADAIVIAHCVADALKFAWDHSMIVHCDVKPDNVMIDGDGTIKVTDLGIARAVSTISTRSGSDDDITIMGTPNYMSPEQVMGDKNLDCRADIYALGMSLYHLLTGILPFDEKDVSMTMQRQTTEKLEYPQKVIPDLSTGFSRMIVKMTAKNSKDRYQNWDELLNEIIPLEDQILSARTKSTPDVQLQVSGETIPIRVAGEVCAVKLCPYCSKSVKKAAVFCPFCGRRIQDQVCAERKTNKRAKIKIKLKTQPPDEKKRITAPVPKPVKKKRQRASNIGGNLRFLASLALIIFLFYYGYNRIVRNRDIIIPIRMKIYRSVIPAWYQFKWKIKALLSGRNSQTSNHDALREETEPVNQEPDTAAAVAVSDISSVPEANKITDDRNVRDEDFPKILHMCEKECPKIGSHVSVKLKDRAEKVEGVVEQFVSHGVVVRVQEGDMVCPFAVMEEKTRLLFSPEERARKIWERRKAN